VRGDISFEVGDAVKIVGKSIYEHEKGTIVNIAPKGILRYDVFLSCKYVVPFHIYEIEKL
jgi:hypothetical protein